MGIALSIPGTAKSFGPHLTSTQNALIRAVPGTRMVRKAQTVPASARDSPRQVPVRIGWPSSGFTGSCDRVGHAKWTSATGLKPEGHTAGETVTLRAAAVSATLVFRMNSPVLVLST